MGETFIYSKNNNVRIEYGEIINASEISNGDDAMDDVWNEYNHQKVPDKEHSKFLNSLITDDDRKLMISRKSSRNLKANLKNRNIMRV